MEELAAALYKIISFCADNFVNIITFSLTVLTASFATLEFRENRFETRIRRFVLSGRALGADENRYTDSALAYYRAHPQGMKVEHLVFMPEWIKPMLPIEAVKVRFEERDNPDYSELAHAFVANIPLPLSANDLSENARLYLENNMFDHPTLGLCDIASRSDGIELRVTLGGFYDYYNTCTAFSFETAYEMLNYRRRTPGLRSIRSDNRFRLMNTKARFCAIGIDTLSVFVNVADSDTPMFLLHKRSNKVATAANLISVVPSGYYQPDSLVSIENGRLSEDIAIDTTILREFAEELCGRVELSDGFSREHLSRLFGDLAPMIENIFYLGSGFDALSTHFELLTMNVIDVKKHPSFGTTSDEILKKLTANYESKRFFMNELTKTTLAQYITAYNSTPVLRQIMRIVLDNFDMVAEKLAVIAKGEAE